MAPHTEGNLRSTINLRIVSPSPELRNGFTLADVPVSTTIAALKRRIQDDIAPHPRADRQRLIYRGRALQRDEETLLDVFGRVSIQEEGLHALHLVLPERQAPAGGIAASTSHTLSRPPSVPPNPFRPASSQSPPSNLAARNPFRPQNEEQHTHPLHQAHGPGQQTLHLPGTARVNANVNIQAHTANGTPVQLPQEMLNNILNQHFAAHGVLPNMFPGLPQPGHQHPHVVSPLQPAQTGQNNHPLHPQHLPVNTPSTAMPQLPIPNGRPSSLPRSDLPTPFQQFIAQQQQERASSGIQAAVDHVTHQFIHPPPSVEHSMATQRNDNQQTSTPSDEQAPRPTADAPLTAPRTDEDTHNSSNTETQRSTTPLGNQMPPSAPQMQSTFTITQVQHANPGSPFPLPQHFQAPFPIAPHPAMAGARMGTPPVGFLHPGLPRPVIPAMGMNEALRPSHPPTDLLGYLTVVQRNIHDLSRMIDLLATGISADGQSRHLRLQESAGLQMRARALQQELESYGQNVGNTGSTRSILQPEVAQFQMMYQSLLAQVSVLNQRIDAMASPNLPTAEPSMMSQVAAASTPDATSNPSTVEVSSEPVANPQGTGRPLPVSIPSLPAATSNSISRPLEQSLYLVQNSSGQPHALVVGSTGAYSSLQLPPELLSPLLSTQMPTTQITQVFTDVLREALQPGGLLHFGALQTLVPSQTSLRDTARTIERRLRAQARIERAAAVAVQANAHSNAVNNNGMVNDPNRVLNDQEIQDAIARHRAQRDGAQQNQGAVAAHAGPARPPDEMRDVLAPVVRNLWLLIRLFGLFWVIGLSGKGLYRPLGLVLLAIGIWILQWGIPRRYIDQARQWWQGLLDPGQAAAQGREHQPEIRHEQQQATTQATQESQSNLQAQAMASSTAVAPAQTNSAATASTQPPTPQDAATRLLAAREQRNWNWLVQRRRALERTIALFVASLVPGLGEDYVRQVEERVRREREERERIEQAADTTNGVPQDGSQGSSEEGTDSIPLAPVLPEGETGNDAEASGVDLGVGDVAVRVNKGKQRATEDDAEHESGTSVDAPASSDALG